jgi:Leucine-rich repeat (LRR) protein
MLSPKLSVAAALALKKGSELSIILNNIIDHSHNRLNLRSDVAEQLSKTCIQLEEVIEKENNQKAIPVLKDIQDCLQYVQLLYVYPPSLEELNYFNLIHFSSLQELCLNQIPPSTVQHLYSLRKQLKKLIIIHSGITNLFSVLTPISKKWKKKLKPLICNDDLNSTSDIVPKEFCWSNILTLTLSNCGLVRIDESLHFFPNLIDLDLSNNSITYIVHLQDCISLENLNLSHNRIRILSNLERTVGKIHNLNVSFNEIESIDGIDKIYSLESINLSNNFINDMNEVQYLSRLPCLVSVILQNNPVAELKHYRLRVYREFIKVGSLMVGNRPFPTVDKIPITKKELKKLRKLTFMSTTDAMVESSYSPSTEKHEGGHPFFGDLSDLLDEVDLLAEGEYGSYDSGDEPAQFPNDYYRRSMIGGRERMSKDNSSLLRSSLSPRQKSTGSPLRSSLSPLRESMTNRSSSVNYRELNANNFADISDGNDFDYSRRSKSSFLLRRSTTTMRFMKRPSNRMKRLVTINDGEVVERAITLLEVEEDLRANPEGWVQPERIHSSQQQKHSHDLTHRGSSRDHHPHHHQEKENVPANVTPSEGTDSDAYQVSTPFPTSSSNAVTADAHKSSSTTTFIETHRKELLPSNVFLAGKEDREPSPPPAMYSLESSNQDSTLIPIPYAYYATVDDENENNAALYQQNGNGNEEGMITKSQDSVLLKIDPYVGDVQYRNLLVYDNLELYFREQVFPSARPCYPDLYLRDNQGKAFRSPSVGGKTAESNNNNLSPPRTPTKSTTSVSADFSLKFLSSFAPEEKFITLFSEKIIDLKDPANFSSSVNVGDMNEDENDLARRSSLGTGRPERASEIGPPQTAATANVAQDNGSERVLKEINAVMVLTDCGFYVIDMNDINPNTTFAETPLLSVLHALPLYKLR